MRTRAGTSSPLSSPTSGLSTTPAKWPSRVSRSTPATSAYSCARCSGLRVWKASARSHWRSAISVRIWRGERMNSPYSAIDRLRQRPQLAADQLGARVVHDHVAARVVGARRAVELLDVLRLVPVEEAGDAQHGDDLAVVHQRGRVADAQAPCLVVGDREGDRRRPRVVAEAVTRARRGRARGARFPRPSGRSAATACRRRCGTPSTGRRGVSSMRGSAAASARNCLRRDSGTVRDTGASRPP